MTVDYNVTSVATAVGSGGRFGYLDTKAYAIWLIYDNGDRHNISLEQNSSGLFSATVMPGIDYQLMIQRRFIGSSTSNHNSRVLIDATQSAKFNWQIPSADSVAGPAPTTIWLFGMGLIGLVRVTRCKTNHG